MSKKGLLSVWRSGSGSKSGFELTSAFATKTGTVMHSEFGSDCVSVLRLTSDLDSRSRTERWSASRMGSVSLIDWEWTVGLVTATDSEKASSNHWSSCYGIA